MLGELEFIKVEYLALNACKRLCPTDFLGGAGGGGFWRGGG